MTLHFHTGAYDEACDLVCRFHYSKRVPSNVQCVGTWHEDGGLFGDFGKAVAACFFSIPPTRWSEDVLELSRLVKLPDVQCSLTGLISQTASVAKANGHDLLVSFADWTHGHHGGVYQAASWRFHGQRPKSQDGVIWNGAFVPGRAANSRWGTRSVTALRGKLGDSHSVEPSWDEGKYLYWRALNKSGVRKAQRLDLKSNAYPKPDAALKVAQ